MCSCIFFFPPTFWYVGNALISNKYEFVVYTNPRKHDEYNTWGFHTWMRLFFYKGVGNSLPLTYEISPDIFVPMPPCGRCSFLSESSINRYPKTFRTLRTTSTRVLGWLLVDDRCTGHADPPRVFLPVQGRLLILCLRNDALSAFNRPPGIAYYGRHLGPCSTKGRI